MTARERIVAADKARVWHPYAPMDEYLASDPLVVARAEGAWLYDVDGRAYLDANASWWTSVLGHRHPRLVAALTSQLAQLDHCALAGITHAPAAELAEALLARSPGMSRIFYVDDGSTAVEAAIKLSVQHARQTGRPGRHKLVTLGDSFHGDTVGAASVSGVEVFRRPFGAILFETIRVDVSSPAREGWARAFAQLSDVVRRDADAIAAVILEPVVQGAAGMLIYPPELLRGARRATAEHDVTLILDEVFTGYGRTGAFWASEHAGVSADLVCTAKGFSGGMLPMGAVLATERIFDAFRGARDRAFYYGHSFTGNPLGAAVGREVLRVFDDERVLEGVAPRTARIRATFERLGRRGGVARARSLGMVGALDLEGGGGYLAGAGWRVFDEARRRGAYLRPLGDVVYVTPSINVPLDDLDRLLAIVEESVEAALRA